MNETKYCPECQQTRDKKMALCPNCSQTKPRYKVEFNSTAGMNFVYDRWSSEVLSTEEIVFHLNSAFDYLSALLEDGEDL